MEGALGATTRAQYSRLFDDFAEYCEAEGLSPVTLAVGAGGTGKSEMVH